MPSENQRKSPLPSSEDWDEWKHHPCTKLLVAWAEKERLNLMEMWAKGNFSAAFTVEMAVKNAGATGACSVYEDLIDLDYQQIEGAMNDQSDGTQPSGPSSPM